MLRVEVGLTLLRKAERVEQGRPPRLLMKAGAGCRHQASRSVAVHFISNERKGASSSVHTRRLHDEAIMCSSVLESIIKRFLYFAISRFEDLIKN